MKFFPILLALLGVTGAGLLAAPTPGDKVGVLRNLSPAALWLEDANGSGFFEGIPPDRAFIFGELSETPNQPLLGDWNGLGTTKVGFRHGCYFILDYNGNGQWDGPTVDRAFYSCLPVGATVLVGDWNGDGRAKLGYFTNGFFFLDQRDDGSFNRIVALGQMGDVPVVGDWNGDKRTKVGIFRNGLWVLDYNGNGAWDGLSNGDVAFYLGQAGDSPIVGDWNGDKRSKAGVQRLLSNSPFGFNSTLWVLDYNGNQSWDGPGTDRAIFFPRAIFNPVQGDWTNDGRTKLGFFENGTFYLDLNGDGSFSGLSYLGQTGDIPLIGRW